MVDGETAPGSRGDWGCTPTTDGRAIHPCSRRAVELRAWRRCQPWSVRAVVRSWGGLLNLEWSCVFYGQQAARDCAHRRDGRISGGGDDRTRVPQSVCSTTGVKEMPGESLYIGQMTTEQGARSAHRTLERPWAIRV